MTSASLMHGAGNSKPVFWDNLEGWDGEGCGRGVQDGGCMCLSLIYFNVCQKTSQYYKVIILQLTQIKW